VIAHQILMAIPIRAHFFCRSIFRSGSINLHKSHSALHQTPGLKTLAAKWTDVFVVELIELTRGLATSPRKSVTSGTLSCILAASSHAAIRASSSAVPGTFCGMGSI